MIELRNLFDGLFQAPTQGNPMRGKPVFMANRAGEWLFDSVYPEWISSRVTEARKGR